LVHLRRHGFAADLVERWIAKAGIRRDLFHCIDVVAVKAGEGVLGVQATVLSCLSARLAKVRVLPDLATWLSAGARFQVWGWVKRDGRWHCKVVELDARDMQPVVIQSPPRKRRRSRWQPGDLFAESVDPRD
jgi:hypothetical protein